MAYMQLGLPWRFAPPRTALKMRITGGSQPALESLGLSPTAIAPTSWPRGLLFYLCAFIIVASLVLGGGTRGGFLSDAVLQLLSIPLLLIALWKLLEIPWTAQMKITLCFCLALVAIPAVQLIPLPPWLWSALPGREPSVETFEILGQKLPWMPISVVPNETWLSALSLIPPLSIFLATLQFPYRERRWLSLIFLAMGVVSVFLGFIQVAQGESSPWRFFTDTNPAEAVGFFANKNHFAALLYSVILFAAAWMVDVAAKFEQQPGKKKYDTASIVTMIAVFTLLVTLLGGEAIARSRMGLLLTIFALFGAAALAVSDRRVGIMVNAMRLIVGAGVLALIFSSQFVLYGIMERFVSDPLKDARTTFARDTIDAAIANMPFGSGLGTFVPVYAMFERPQDTLIAAYVNHAHNDILEVWLTSGVLGSALLGMFVAWLILQSIEIWRSAPPRGASEFDWNLARSATLVVAFLVVHSFVDYPLRTGGMMAVMAFACALLIEPPVGADTCAQQTPGLEAKNKTPKTLKLAPAATLATPKAVLATKPTGKLAPKSTPTDLAKPVVPMPTLMPVPAPVPKPLAAPPSSEVGALSPDRRWGTDIAWPEEWSSKASSASGGDNEPSGPKSPKGS
jgi:O-antigen ligase